MNKPWWWSDSGIFWLIHVLLTCCKLYISIELNVHKKFTLLIQKKHQIAFPKTTIWRILLRDFGDRGNWQGHHSTSINFDIHNLGALWRRTSVLCSETEQVNIHQSCDWWTEQCHTWLHLTHPNKRYEFHSAWIHNKQGNWRVVGECHSQEKHSLLRKFKRVV